MASGGGLGRGGRGALLLKALETPVKTPGYSNGNISPPGGVKPPQQSTTDGNGSKPSSTKVIMGRGLLAQHLAQQMKVKSQLPPDEKPKTISPPPLISPGLPTAAGNEEKPSVSLPELEQLTVTEKPLRKDMKKGESGTPIPLNVNYIGFKCRKEGAFQYAVSFNPPIESKNMRYGMLSEHKNTIGSTKAFDGAVLYLPHKLPQAQTKLWSKRITDNTEVELTITLVKVLHPTDCLHLYNIVLRRLMKALELSQVGRYYYDPNRPCPIPQHLLELWPGYITSIQAYEGGVMLLADVSHRLLRTDTVLTFMYDFIQKYPERFQKEVTKQLVGNVVLTRYNNKTYRIDDIAWDKSPESKFTYFNGEEMTYIEYYRRQYSKEVTDTGQPLLIHRPKESKGVRQKGKPLEVICLIPEFCSMTGLTDTIRSDFRVMKDIAQHTRVTPNQRKLAMTKFLENVRNTPAASQVLKSWNLELDNKLLSTEGRQLPLEKITFGSKTVLANEEADWGREVTRERVILAVDINSWLVLCTSRDQGKANDFINTMKQCCPQMGIRCNNPRTLPLRDDRTETYLRAIRENLNAQVQMVVCIFPTSRDDRYNAVKKLCCVESPVPSQCINAKTISHANKLRSVTQKIALQINCKLGGELWALQIPMKNVMIVGIDVYHDVSKSSRSIGGFVASTNKTFTRWFSRCCFQAPGQELVDGLKLCFISALKKYHDENHSLPDKIVVFRDGVGDGQLDVISNYEVKQFQECFSHLGASYEPKLCVIVVQKRISQRLFSVANNSKLENPKPGSVLDHTITRREWVDFFLVSQHVRQGTVTPTHYVVVYDDSGMKPDHIQRLSYKLTHLYYNWPGTIRVPAPCQYAHKLAYLVGQSLHKEPSADLSDRLFFL